MSYNYNTNYNPNNQQYYGNAPGSAPTWSQYGQQQQQQQQPPPPQQGGVGPGMYNTNYGSPPPQQQQQPYNNQLPPQQQQQYPPYQQPPMPSQQQQYQQPYPPPQQQQPQMYPSQPPQQPYGYASQQPPPQQQQARPAAANNNRNVRGGRLMRPPYVDPNTNIIYDVDNPDYEGYLTKQSVWLKEWRRRYFILKGSKLFFCKNDYSAPHGMMDLASCTTVKSADLKSKKRHSFEISTPETCYLLYADTESEKDDWIGRVGKAIVRCSRTYYDANGQPRGGATGTGMNDRLNDGTYGEQQDEDDDIYENDDPDNPYFND